jgi:hypothetical protein
MLFGRSHKVGRFPVSAIVLTLVGNAVAQELVQRPTPPLPWAIFGIGNKKCSEFVSALETNQKASPSPGFYTRELIPYIDWLDGAMTGMNLRSPLPESLVGQRGYSIPDALRQLRDFCGSVPNATFAQAVNIYRGDVKFSEAMDVCLAFMRKEHKQKTNDNYFAECTIQTLNEGSNQ